jgi:UDP-glucuronate 4-epimerase
LILIKTKHALVSGISNLFSLFLASDAMTILVTGAAGFIGYHTINKLAARGEHVLGLDNINDYYDPRLKQARLADLQARHHNKFRFIQCDFADQAALKAALGGQKIKRVVHLGAQAGVRYARTNPEAYVHSNLVGHVNIMEFCRQQEADHLVYASSSSVYGSNSLPEQGFSVEQRVDQPRSLYAATKKADELMSETYAYLYKLPQTGLRFFTVYGPWGRPDMALWLFTKAILAGEPITVYNNGQMRRDFTYIDDIVAGVIACLDNPPKDDGLPKAGGSTSPHRVYNIGNHRSEELMRMIGVLEHALGRQAIKNFAPMQPDDVQDTYADIRAIAQDLGYVPTTTIDEGIPKFIAWYKSYHQL